MLRYSMLLLALAPYVAAADFRIGCYDGYAPKELTESFTALVKERLGKDINCVTVTMTDNQSIFDAIRGKRVDVVSATNNGFKAERFRFIQGGLVAPIDVAALAHWKDVIPAIATTESINEGGKVYAVPLNYSQYGLSYQVSRFPQPPTSWSVLLDPQRSFAISNDWEVCTMAVAGLISGLPKEDIFSFEKLNTPAVKSVARQLASTKHKWSGVDDAATLKGLDAAASWGFSIADLGKAGEVWTMAEPKEGAPWYLDTFAIASNSPDDMRDVAILWLDYVISPVPQAYYARNLGVKAVSVGAKSVLNPAEAAAAGLDDPTFFSTKVALLKPLSLRDENGIKRLWDEAKTAK